VIIVTYCLSVAIELIPDMEVIKMDQKIIGILPLMVALLLVAAFAAGDNPVIAANNTTQTASIHIADVIAIETPSVVNNSWASTDSTTLFFLNNTLGQNTVTSRSNGRIDVFIRSNTGSSIPHVDPSYSTDTLTEFQYRSNVTGIYTSFTNAFVEIIDRWKISQGTGSAGATISVPLMVFVPSYTDDGFYNSTVTYAAVRHGHPAPP